MKIEFIITIIILLSIIFCFSFNIRKKERFTNYDTVIKYPIYWINLKKSVDRYNNIKKQFKKYKLINKRINAVNGKSDNLNKLVKNKLSFFRSNKIEISCLLSHLFAIRKSIKNNDNISIICEDDLCFDLIPHWKIKLDKLIDELPYDWDIVNLAPTNHLFLQNNINSDKNFVTWKNYHWGAMCYLINRKGMLKLNKNHNLMDKKFIINTDKSAVADDVLYSKLNSYTVTKPLFTYLNNGSTIHSYHEQLHKLGKDIILKFYNVKVCKSL
jgi:GR25 family glycosyltransferase involved in LPS biosynthesis